MPKTKALFHQKQTTDTIAGNESSVCRKWIQCLQAHQQLARTDTVSDPSVSTCESVGAPRHSWEEKRSFCISTSSVVADVAAHYTFRTHPCAAVSTEPPAGCPVACTIWARAFHSRLWRHVHEANCENSEQSILKLELKMKTHVRYVWLYCCTHSETSQTTTQDSSELIQTDKFDADTNSQEEFRLNIHLCIFIFTWIRWKSLGYLYWFHGVWFGCTCSQGSAAFLYVNLFTHFSVPVRPVLLVGWNQDHISAITRAETVVVCRTQCLVYYCLLSPNNLCWSLLKLMPCKICHE